MVEPNKRTQAQHQGDIDVTQLECNNNILKSLQKIHVKLLFGNFKSNWQVVMIFNCNIIINYSDYIFGPTCS